MNTEVLTVSLGDRTYDIFFGEDIYSLFQEWICRFYPGGSVFVVTDRNVASIYGGDIRRWLTGIPHHIHEVPPGEEAKNWETVQGVYAFLARGNADRDALVVAFGGGIVGDLAGFAAATFLRGVPYIQVPTTLLSQVDSSVGGKTGFNLPGGKNLVGAFHQPRAVFIDHTFLRTLDERNLRAGMAEVVKCALAGDPELWETLCAAAPRWKALSGREWRQVIRRSVAFKAAVVERDEKESSVRRILNLGHTIGHALEQAAGYGNLLHGEAVAMGLAWEAIFSRRQGMTPPDVEERLFALLRELGFALDEPGLALSSIASAIGMDKKRVSSDVDLPVVAAAGSCVLKRVPLSLLRKELPAIRAEIGRRSREGPIGAAEESEFLARLEAGDPAEAVAALEQRVAAAPRDLRGMILLSGAYRRAGNRAAAWETIKEALHQYPSDARAQGAAREIEEELRTSPRTAGEAPAAALEDVVLLEEGSFEIRPADRIPEAAGEGKVADKREETPEEPVSPVRTITMADICWEQGEKEMALRIIEGILSGEPGNRRALEWKETHRERSGAEAALAAFLGAMAKEYGYDLSGPH